VSERASKQSSNVLRRVAASLLLPLLGSCSDGNGIVEVYWQFNDADLRRVYPVGVEPDTCELESQSGVRYDLRVRLTIVANTQTCIDDWNDPGCEVIEQLLFPCNRSRGTALEVPPSATDDEDDPGYLMIVETMVDPTDTSAFVPDSSCVTGPGPRVRQVRPGRITDLELYQFVVHAIDTRDVLLLDIDACRP
jgi:hypothetical protein